MKELVDQLRDEVRNARLPGSAIYDSVMERLERSRGSKIDIEALLDVIADVASGSSTHEVLVRAGPRVSDRIVRLMENNRPTVDDALKAMDEQIRVEAILASQLLSVLTDKILRVCAGANSQLSAETFRLFLGELTRQQFVDSLGHPIDMQRVNTSANTVALAPLVATTNYDLSVESYFSTNLLQYVNGFKQVGAEHEFEFDPNLFDNPAGTPLVKLHGSIDWWKTRNGRVIETKYGHVGDSLRNGDVIREPCIRYPVSEKQLFEYPFLELYSRFARYLTAAKIWIFIGYSFGDPSIRNLVKDLARPEKKLIVVHPDAVNIVSNVLGLSAVMPTCAISMKFPHNQVTDSIRAFGVRAISPPFSVAVS